MMIDSLRQSRQWVRLLCILGFITAGLMMLVGISSQFAGILAAMSLSSRLKPLFSSLAMILIGLAYMCLAVLCFIPALQLHELADAIKRLPTQDGASGMEEALRHQRLSGVLPGLRSWVQSWFRLLSESLLPLP